MKFANQFIGTFLIITMSFIQSAYASPMNQNLVISIDKIDGMSCELTEGLSERMDFLTYNDPSMGTEYIQAKIVQYIDFCKIAPDTPYVGVAIVNIEYTSDVKMNFYLDRIIQSGKYTLYSNPVVSQ